MSIFPEKRAGQPTGKLIVQVIVDGQTIKRRVSGLKAAREMERDILAGKVKKKADTAGLTNPTVGDMGREAREMWRGKDAAQSQRQLEVVCGLIGPDVQLKDLSTSHIDVMVKGLRARGLSDPTINRYMAVISKALDWAMHRDYLTKKPILPWHKEPKTRFSWLNEDDEAKLVAWLQEPENLPMARYRSAKKRGRHIGPTMAVLVRVLIITGIRVGELLQTKPEDVDLDDEALKLWDPEAIKTGEPRTQYLPRALGEALRAELALGLPDYDTMTHAFYAARDALGLDPELKIHSLRHTTATRLAQKDVNHRTIMEYMGHRSMATTNRYTHVSQGAKRRAGALLMGGA